VPWSSPSRVKSDPSLSSISGCDGLIVSSSNTLVLPKLNVLVARCFAGLSPGLPTTPKPLNDHSEDHDTSRVFL